MVPASPKVIVAAVSDRRISQRRSEISVTDRRSRLEPVNLSLVGPIFRSLNQARTNRILPHVLPFLPVRFLRPDHMVKKSFCQCVSSPPFSLSTLDKLPFKAFIHFGRGGDWGLKAANKWIRSGISK
jgi:hypothetical protein